MANDVSNLHRTIDVRNIRQDSAVTLGTKLNLMQQIALINNVPLLKSTHTQTVREYQRPLSALSSKKMKVDKSQ